MHSFADHIVAAVGEGYITHAAADLGAWATLFDLPGCLNEVDGVLIMFFNTSCYRKNIWVEDDVLWWEAYLLGQDIIGAFANFYFAFGGVSLARFIEGLIAPTTETTAPAPVTLPTS